MKMKKWLKIALAGAVALGLIAQPATAEALTVQEVQDKGEIVLGTSADFPPFEWVKMVDGQETTLGADIELAQAIADELGVELVIRNSSFDSLITQVQTGKVDMVIAGMSYTPERAEQALFSDVYFTGTNYFLTNHDTAATIQSLDDVHNLRLGVQRGSIQEALLKEHVPEATDLTMIPDNGDLVQSLLTNRIDAILFDHIVATQFAAQHEGKLQIVEGVEVPNGDDGGMSIVVSNDSQELLDVINKVIGELTESGQYEAWIEEYIPQIDQIS